MRLSWIPITVMIVHRGLVKVLGTIQRSISLRVNKDALYLML